jgi:uncharacterized protein involved in exopolysaccharide biosynthesis
MNTVGETTSIASENDLVQLIKLLWRNRWIIIGSTVVGGGIAVFLALSATPTFRAEATVTEVTNGQLGGAASLANQFGGLASLVGVNLSGLNNNGREAQALLKSRRLCEEFVVRNKLIPILYPPPAKQPTMWMAVKHLRDDIVQIRDDKRAGLTIVAVTWKDPVVAARWANEFVGLANELMRARDITDSQSSIDYLNKQITTVSEVEVKKVMYGLIESETKTLMLANSRKEYALTVVDPAVAPELKFAPRRTLMTLLGLVLGGVVGVLIALGVHLIRQFRAPTRPYLTNQ